MRLSEKIDEYDCLLKYNDRAENFEQIEKLKKGKNLIQTRITKIDALGEILSEKCFGCIEDNELTHDLAELMQKIKNVYHVDSRIKKLFDTVLPILNHYKEIDPNGDVFRYWCDVEGDPHFEGKDIGIVKIDIVAIHFEEITRIFSEIDWEIWYLTKEYETGTFTKDLSRLQIEEISKLLPSPEEFPEKIKEIKEDTKKKYKIGSNKFDNILKMICRHREFSSYMGKEKIYSFLSNHAMKIFAECSLSQHSWEEASKEINSDELTLLYLFYDISGCIYIEKEYAYFSEDLHFLHSHIKRKRRIRSYDINPVSGIMHVINGMKKCGQITYANKLEEYITSSKNDYNHI